MSLRSRGFLIFSCLVTLIACGILSPSMAQQALQLRASDCVAEKDAMRRAGFSETDIQRGLRPIGVQNGIDVALAQDNKQKLLYFKRIAIAGHDFSGLARYDLALCVLNTALDQAARSQNAANAASERQYPYRKFTPVPQQKTIIRRGNDTNCVEYRAGKLWNTCTFTVDVSFCVTNPQQTKGFFDNSSAFKCPGGGLIALGSGLSSGSSMYGTVHWFACNVKNRASSHTEWNPRTENYTGYCEEIRQ